MTDGLAQAVRIVVEKDSSEFRQSVFEDLARQRRSVRWARRVYDRLGRGWASTLYVAGYGVKSFLAVRLPKKQRPVLAATLYANERRQVNDVAQSVGADQVASIDLSNRAALRADAWRAFGRWVRSPPRVARYLSTVRKNNRGDFLVACRAASTAAYFLRFDQELRDSRARGVLVSSDSNPYAMGLAFAARKHGLKTIYVNHGHIPDGPHRLSFDLSLLDGPALLEVYRRNRGTEGQVVFKGVEGAYRPLRTSGLERRGRFRLGVFASLIVDWPAFARVFARIQERLRPEAVLLRLHPNHVIRDRRALEHVGDWANLKVSFGSEVLLSDAEQCDLVLIGNSSCHLTVLKYGIPSAYVRGLDIVPHDFYRFLEDRIVIGFDRPEDLDLEAIARFYGHPDWVRRFGHVDGAYGIDRATVEARVRDAIQRLMV